MKVSYVFGQKTFHAVGHSGKTVAGWKDCGFPVRNHVWAFFVGRIAPNFSAFGHVSGNLYQVFRQFRRNTWTRVSTDLESHT